MRATQNRFHQLDETEYTCSAKQARKRWTAEGVFGFIMNTPSLNRRIPFEFIKYTQAAYSVAFLTLLTYKHNVEPVGWKACLQWLKDRRHPPGVDDGAGEVQVL